MTIVLVGIFIAYDTSRRQHDLRDRRWELEQLALRLKGVMRANDVLLREMENLKMPMHGRLMRGEIEQLISGYRGLKFHQPVAYRTLPREKIRDYLMSKLGEQYTPEEFRQYGLALQRIGLIPTGTDLLATLSDLLSEQVAAFYDQETHELYTFEETEFKNNLERMILSHELVHALQDQNFNLKSLALKAKDNDDAALASAALVEGDANYHMGHYLRENYRTDQMLKDIRLAMAQRTERILSAPPYLRDSLLFPYQEGQQWVSELYASGGQAAIDAAYTHPPSSTEQVLHPEKFLSKVREEPREVATELKLDSAWKKVHENVVGELGIRSLFSKVLGRERAELAAAGWGGDRYAMWEGARGAWILVWKSVWDTEADARQFFEALHRFYAIKYDNKAGLGTVPGETGVPGEAVLFSLADQRQCIVLCDDSVLFVEAPNAKIMGRIAGMLLPTKKMVPSVSAKSQKKGVAPTPTDEK